MNYLLLLLLILILSIIYTGSQKSSKDRLSVTLLVFLIIVLFGYLQVPNVKEEQNSNYLLREPFELAPVKYTISPNTCDGVDYDKINPIKHQLTDSYDGLILNEDKPTHKELSVEQVAYHTPTGDAKALNLPEGSDNLFMFSYNRSHPSCCPSTYSSSRGCVCLTDEQKKNLSSRGGNI